MQTSFVNRVGFLGVALAALVGVSSGVLSYLVTRTQLESSLRAQLDTSAKVIATHLGGELRNLYDSLLSNAGNTLFANALADSAGRDLYLRPFLSHFRGVGTVPVVVALADFGGEVLASNLDTPRYPLDADLLRRVVAQHQAAATLTVWHQELLFTLSVPIVYPNTGEAEGSLSYQFLFSGLTSDVWMHDEQEAFMTLVSGPGIDGLFSATVGPPIPHDALQHTVSVQTEPPLDDWRLRVRVWHDIGVVEQESWRLVKVYAALGLGGMLLIAPLSLWLARRLLRRLKALETTALNVIQSGSLNQRFVVEGRDEVANLGQVFNHMLEQLAAAQAELQREARREVAHQAQRYQRMLAASLEGFVRIDLPEGWVEEANPRFCQMLGQTSAEVENRPIPSALHSLLQQALSYSAKDSSYSAWSEEMRLGPAGGPPRVVLCHANLDLDLDGKRQLLVFLADITDRKQAEERTREVNVQLSASLAVLQRHDHELTLLNRMNDLLLACRSRDEVFQVVRRTAAELFPDSWGGLAMLEPSLGRDVLRSVVTWGEPEMALAQFELGQCWAMRQGSLHQVENPARDLLCQHFTQSPRQAYVCLPLMVQGRIMGLLTVSRPNLDYPQESWQRLVYSFGDTIKLAVSNLDLRNALHEQAVRDPLTGLYNRRHFSEVIVQELARCERQNGKLALAMVDLDHFKQINDSYGHETGDLVLQQFSEVLRKKRRRSDVLFRYGGEEFVVLLPDTEREGAYYAMDELRARLEQTLISQRGEILRPVTISVGIAVYPTHGKDEDSLLRAADAAVYQAKAEGRNRVVLAAEVC